MAQWKQSTFSCMDDMGKCAMSSCCPCVMFGMNAATIGESCCLCGLAYFLCPLVSCTFVRGKIRQKRAIDGSAVMDCVCHAGPQSCCSIAQEAVEVESLKGQGDGPATSESLMAGYQMAPNGGGPAGFVTEMER